MNKIPHKAQSTLEYTLLIGTVVAVLIVVLLKEGGMKTRIGNAYNNTTSKLSEAVNHLTISAFSE